MNPSRPQQQNFGHRATQAITRLFVVLLILGLGGAVLFLLSQLNARTYSLTLENGELVVMKGRLLPMGSARYHPGEARLADAYSPIPVEGRDVSTLVQQRFGDREELDRALFPMLESLARPRIESDEPERVERGLYFLRRAELLPGLTQEQRHTLEAMKADVAFYQARLKLERARREVAEAMVQLRLAAEHRTRHTQRAREALSVVGPAASALEQALRAVEANMAPAGTPPPPRPREESPQAPGTPTPSAPPEPELQPTDSETRQRPAPEP
jgi:hypothetical protein